MKLSRSVVYAVQATLQIAQDRSGLPVPCSKVAAAGNMPEKFLLQILRDLVTGGVLRSTRGVEGGYQLERPAEMISLLEIIQAVDKPLLSLPEAAEEEPVDLDPRLREALRSVARAARAQLGSIKLADLIKPPRGK